MDLSLRASSLPSVLCARASSSLLALNDYLCLGASLTEAHALNFNLFPHLQYHFLQRLIISVLFWDVGDSAAVSWMQPPPPVVNSRETNCCLPHSTSLWQTHHYASAHPQASLAQTKTVSTLLRASFICKMPILNNNFPFFNQALLCFPTSNEPPRAPLVRFDTCHGQGRKPQCRVICLMNACWITASAFFINVSSSKTLQLYLAWGYRNHSLPGLNRHWLSFWASRQEVWPLFWSASIMFKEARPQDLVWCWHGDAFVIVSFKVFGDKSYIEAWNGNSLRFRNQQ